MEKVIKKLRAKYIISASLISLSVVILMLVILNVLMNITYYSDSDAVLEMILHNQRSYDIKNESFTLADMEKNPDGDFIIPRCIDNIESVTLRGSITSKNIHEDWYNAGGGIMFEQASDNGEKKLVYHEYTFSKDICEVTVDLTDPATLKYDNSTSDYAASMVDNNNFLVSIVWWASSSGGPANTQKDICLDLDSITVHYKKELGYIPHMSYSESFHNNIPDLVRQTHSFCIITDSTYKLIAVNDGNMATEISDSEASQLLNTIKESDRTHGSLVSANGIQLRYMATKSDQYIITAFAGVNDKRHFLKHLLSVSVISGIIMFAVIITIIFIVSDKIIKPVSDTFEKQKQFISNAGHELKTPITVISAAADLLEKTTPDNRWSDCIKAQSAKMSRLINELLELSRLGEAKNKTADFARFVISDTVRNTVLYFESRAFEEKHSLICDISENITFFGSEVRTERLTGILIDNALKYSDPDSDICVKLSQNKDGTVISCSNLCSRIDQNDIDHLFERFYRSEKSHCSQTPGFGLGLSIAQAIADLHNGSISVKYDGSVITFRVLLP